ncbi:MAG: MFS transporter [Melioribacteraceae bacterium]
MSQFFYRAGTRSLIPFLPLFIQDLGKTTPESTAIWSGWIFAAPFIISFFTTPFWGSFGDKYGRKLMTILAVFGFAAAQFLMGFSANLTQLILFASLQEAMGGFYPAAVSLTASNTPKEKTAQALGILQFANGSGNVIGPILGGILADLVGLRVVFFLIAITVGLSGFLIVFFIDEKNFTREDHNYYFLTKNWRYVFDNKKLIICMLFLLIYSLAVTVVRPTFSLFIKSMNFTLNNSSTVTGILLGVFGGTSALASALVGKLTIKRKINSILLFASIVVTATYFLLSVVSSASFLIIVLAVGGFGLGLIQPLVFTLVSYNTDDNRKAGVFGVGSSFQVIGNLFGSVSAGYIVAEFGLRFPFVAAGLLFIIVVTISKIGLKGK